MFLAVRKFAFGYHRLTCDGDAICLQNSWRQIRLEPHCVQALVGAGGVNFDSSDAIVWRSIVLIFAGQRYTISFDKVTNAICYQRLREVCRHAWGLPFQGKLETPLAGPELDPDDYADSLRHVRRVYLMLTQQAMFSGLLMLGGSIAAGIGMAAHMQGGFGRGRMRLYFWLVVTGVVGLLLTYRAIRQIPVLFSIRTIERRLREAI
jgi:hypothetical protein